MLNKHTVPHYFYLPIMMWFLDFVGFQISKIGFIVKEITILSSEGDRCYNYFITGPKEYPSNHYKTLYFQYNMHKLQWDFGDYEFDEAMTDIACKLRTDTVYIKGKEKFEFISSIFPRPKFIELEKVPAFKHLNNCLNERCEVKHGNHCARRKVYEIRDFITKTKS